MPKIKVNEFSEMCPTSIDEAVDKAAQFLPEGYTVIIQVEKEGYGVELQYPDHLTHDHGNDHVDGGDGIISDINEAIIMARANEENEAFTCMVCGVEDEEVSKRTHKYCSNCGIKIKWIEDA